MPTPTPQHQRAAGRVVRRLTVLAGAALLAAALPLTATASPPTVPVLHGVEVSAAVHHDVSAPLGDAPRVGPTAPSAANMRERPLRITGPGARQNQADGAVQAPPATNVATSSGLNFEGLGVCVGSIYCYAPPDTVGAVGATQYVQWVNAGWAVYNKTTGAMASGFPKAGNSLWQGFGGGCEANNDGDPIVQYDKAEDRWILTQFSVSTTPYLQCVAVSTSSDATGSYNRYSFSYNQFNDYPKLGVWPDAYYITFNMFTSSFQGPRVCAYDKAAMMAGSAAQQECFQLGTSAGSLLPGDLDGSQSPPAGAPNPILSLGNNSLQLWRFHADFANPGNATLTGPTSIPVASFSRACNGGGNCIPQPSTNQKLDSLGDRLMYRLAYRNTGGHDSVVVNHSVSVGGGRGPFGGGTTSVRWYEVRNVTSGTPSVFQQGTLDTGDGTHRWMGSIAMDKAGNIALGYSASSSSVYPAIRYTGRLATDPLGTMAAETSIIEGGGSQTQNLSRWGDYSAMTVDPVDDCTFWYTNEYLTSNGTWNWHTRIASFKFPGCDGGGSTPDFSISANPTSLSLAQGASGQSQISTTAIGTPGTVALTADVTPGSSGVSASLDTSSVTAGGSAQLTVTASSGAVPGAYVVTVHGVEGSASHDATVNVTVTSSGPTSGPSEPLGLSASAGPGKGITLTWSPPADSGSSAVVSYNVYRSSTAGGPYTLIASSSNTKYKDTATVVGVAFYYVVTALNGDGLEGPRSAEASGTATK